MVGGDNDDGDDDDDDNDDDDGDDNNGTSLSRPGRAGNHFCEGLRAP